MSNPIVPDFFSYHTIYAEDWAIKVSTMGRQIQVFMFNSSLGECQIEWFDNNMDAMLWIDYMTSKYD